MAEFNLTGMDTSIPHFSPNPPVPNSPAIIFRNETITYEELSEQIRNLTRVLRKSGVAEGDVVGLMLDRSVQLIAALYAIWETGAVYVPVDPGLPEKRRLRMLDDSGALWVLGSEGLVRRNIVRPSIQMDTGSLQLAYIIYTSGSTGEPKGVMVSHKSLQNFIMGMQERLALSQYRSVLALTTISFDIFLLEVVAALASGLQVILAGTEEQWNPRAVSALILRHDIQLLQMTPSRLQQMMDDRKFITSLKRVQAILIGGEAVSERLIQRVRQHTNAHLYNMYGPTEATVWCSVDRIEGGQAVICNAIPNAELLILNDQGQRAEIDEMGELCISGACLAVGYWNRPELTGERFIQHPEKPKERLYRTGDMAVSRADGSILVLGRYDNQVKIRGHRIELGEVEACLLEHPDVEEAIVVAIEPEDGMPKLAVCYRSLAGLSASQCRVHAAAHLPEYMIPGIWMEVEEIPLTLGGKADRQAIVAMLKTGQDN